MGDYIYTPNGKRKYIGLHGEYLERPWTARKRRRSIENAEKPDCITTRAGLTEASFEPWNPSILGDIRRMAEVYRETLQEFDAMAKFTVDAEAQCDGELQRAKQEVQTCKHEASAILNRCLIDLSNLGNTTKGWVGQVRKLTKAKEDWWEGYNVLLGDVPKHFIEQWIQDASADEAKRYTRYLTRMISITMTQMRETIFSRRRRDSFLQHLHTEMWMLLKKEGTHPSISSFEFCAAIIIHVLLQNPKAIPFSRVCYHEHRIRWALGDTILKYLRKRSKFTVTEPMRNAYPKRVIVGINLAATVRRMRTAIHAYPCIPTDCSHGRFFSSFYEAIRNARREVRWRVHLAVAPRLPVELVEMVVEEAYVAEGVDRFLHHDVELIKVSDSSFVCERSRSSDPRRPSDYSAPDNSDPSGGDSDGTYASDGSVTTTVYTDEADETREDI